MPVNKYALVGIATTVVAAFVLIFPELGNTSINGIAKNIRLVEVTTFGIGNALGVSNTTSGEKVYGNPSQVPGEHNPGEGLRNYYTWGLWNRCAGYKSASDLQYCASGKAGYPLNPTEALTEDIDPTYRDRLTNLLAKETSHMKSDKDFSTWTKMGGYAVLSGVIHMIPLLISAVFLAMGRGPKLVHKLALMMNMPVVMSTVMGAAMWTWMIHNMKNSVNGRKIANDVELGLEVEVGNAIYLLWVTSVILLLGVYPYFMAFRISSQQAAQADQITPLHRFERAKMHESADDLYKQHV